MLIFCSLITNNEINKYNISMYFLNKLNLLILPASYKVGYYVSDYHLVSFLAIKLLIIIINYICRV